MGVIAGIYKQAKPQQTSVRALRKVTCCGLVGVEDSTHKPQMSSRSLRKDDVALGAGHCGCVCCLIPLL
jgi:hypothetical protein